MGYTMGYSMGPTPARPVSRFELNRLMPGNAYGTRFSHGIWRNGGSTAALWNSGKSHVGFGASSLPFSGNTTTAVNVAVEHQIDADDYEAHNSESP